MSSRIIVALDFPESDSALACVRQLSPQACKLKVGKELFTAQGPAFVEKLVGRGFDVGYGNPITNWNLFPVVPR